VVLREEMRLKLWPDDTVVEFDHSISAAVKRLRDALRESAEKPRYIETVARRGYRFIGQVETGAPKTANDQAEARLVVVPAIRGARWPPRPSLLISVALAAILLAALGTGYYYGTAPARWARRIAVPEADRLANAGRYPAAFELLIRAHQVSR
jgi:hypothetical protein